MKIHVPIVTAVEKAAQGGLRAAGKQVLKASNALAPKDDGELIKSGQVRIDDLTVQVSYGTEYAHLQHENLDWRHEEGGQAKFLEAAARQVDIGAIVAEHVRRELGGG